MLWARNDVLFQLLPQQLARLHHHGTTALLAPSRRKHSRVVHHHGTDNSMKLGEHRHGTSPIRCLQFCVCFFSGFCRARDAVEANTASENTMAKRVQPSYFPTSFLDFDETRLTTFTWNPWEPWGNLEVTFTMQPWEPWERLAYAVGKKDLYHTEKCMRGKPESAKLWRIFMSILWHILFRGRRQGRQPLNPGAGPAPVSSPEAFGGNRRLYTAAPPAADHLVSIPVHPRSTIIPVIYSVFCVWCSKNIVFYRVLWPSPSPGFISATLKNQGFFMVLGLRKGSGTENWTSWRPWCQHRANIGQDVGYMGQHKAKIGASLRQHRANIGQAVGYMGRHKGYMGQHKAKIGASLRQHRANIGQDVGYMGRPKAKIGTT